MFQTNGTILIVDDEEKLRSLFKRIVSLEGFRVFEADSLKAALKLLEKEAIDVMLCDVKLPDGNGVEFTRIVKERFSQVEVILLTAYGNIPDGVSAMQNGAFNYITKGDDNARVVPLINQAVEKKQDRDRSDQLNKKSSTNYSFENILGVSPLLQEAIQLARAVAPNSTTVLLLGETGTGKEVFAQAIHQASARSSQKFVALNCSSFSKELLESELFGYKAGAFTNAARDKKGLIEEADKGTLFLDEIGEMPVELQSKLLRVLETSEFIKLGDTKTIKVNVRIIAATNKELEKDVKEGRFREDLFYRLNVYTISLPALRERKMDIPILANYFLSHFSEKIKGSTGVVSAAFLEQLQQQDWKGNIRQLRNAIERAVIVSNGEPLNISHLPVELREAQSKSTSLSAFALSSIEKLHIQRVLIHTNNNKAEAARLLNIGLATLYRKIDDYKL